MSSAKFDLPGSRMQLPAACRQLDQLTLTLGIEAALMKKINHACLEICAS
jgi:hypothetical protein